MAGQDVPYTRIKWIYLAAAIYLVILCASIIAEQYWVMGLPVVAAVALMAIYRLDFFVIVIALLTPLSINISDIGLGYGISLPVEPLLAGVMLLVILKTIYERGFPKEILNHPVSIMLMIYLGWMFFTSLTSTMPLVSVKRFMAQFWFIVVMYFFALQVFRKVDMISRFILFYAFSLVLVITYATVNHARYFFAEKPAHWVMTPFYNDHTAYGAAIALFIPIILILSGKKNAGGNKLLIRGMAAMIMVAIVLSYARAAWLSLVIALGVYVLIRLRIRFRTVAFVTIALVAGYAAFHTQISIMLKSNKQDSSTDYLSHIKSSANVSTDASNLERINRWNCAWRMFKDRPVLGFGPGTYKFKYGPYQHFSEKTIISTDFGEVGGAHSEYLGPLAEEGLMGFLIMVALVCTIIYTGIVLYGKLDSKSSLRPLVLGLLLGLVTYFVHGMLNNFLDTDKAAVPVWGFSAAIVAIDLYHRKYTGKQGTEKQPAA